MVEIDLKVTHTPRRHKRVGIVSHEKKSWVLLPFVCLYVCVYLAEIDRNEITASDKDIPKNIINIMEKKIKLKGLASLGLKIAIIFNSSSFW